MKWVLIINIANVWPKIKQIRIFFTNLKLWIAVARHNLKCNWGVQIVNVGDRSPLLLAQHWGSACTTFHAGSDFDRSVSACPANTRRRADVDLMLAQRCRLWPNLKTALFQRLASAYPVTGWGVETDNTCRFHKKPTSVYGDTPATCLPCNLTSSKVNFGPPPPAAAANYKVVDDRRFFFFSLTREIDKMRSMAKGNATFVAVQFSRAISRGPMWRCSSVNPVLVQC